MTRLLAPILAVLSICTFGPQDANKPQEPEYTNSFFFLDKDGSLKPLERQAPVIETKSGGIVRGGVTGEYVIPSQHSPVRFPASANLQFVVRPMLINADPATIVHLYSLKVSKGRRELQLMKIAGGTGKSTLGNAALPFDASRYGENSILLKPQGNLTPGEYMLTVGGSNYCFGIDPASP